MQAQPVQALQSAASLTAFFEVGMLSMFVVSIQGTAHGPDLSRVSHSDLSSAIGTPAPAPAPPPAQPTGAQQAHAPTPAPAPVAPPVAATSAPTTASQYAAELEQMHSMGFVDDEQNIQALRAANGNVNEAVGMLLGM